MTAIVALQKVSADRYRPAVETVLSDSGCLSLLKRGDRVLIKPNLVTDKPEYIELGANTSVEVLDALLRLLADHGCSVEIVESETGTPTKGRRLEKTWESMGLVELAERYGVRLVNLTPLPRRVVHFPESRAPSLELPECLFECDHLLNIPKIKTHKYAVLTCCMKNLFGVVPEPRRIVYHRWLSEILVELTKLFDDRLIHLVDGIVGMEGNGPLYGKPVELNLLLAGRNGWAVDRVVCDLIGLDPTKIRYLEIGERRGLGPVEIEYLGEVLDKLKRPFEPVSFNLYRSFEKKLMESPLVGIVTSNWFQKHVSRHVAGLTERLRGGGYRWYLDEDNS